MPKKNTVIMPVRLQWSGEPPCRDGAAAEGDKKPPSESGSSSA